MRLRKQLLLASLFSLSLPWLGCQYIREMEESLLQGQDGALKATAQAVAATVASDSELSSLLLSFSAPGGSRPLYMHTFYSPLILDGYHEDWTSYGYKAQRFQGDTSTHQATTLVFGGVRGSEAWLHMRVPTESIEYYNPSKSVIAAHRIQLKLLDSNNKLRQRIIVASGPGRAQVLNEQGAIDRRIKAVWREALDGFQVEVQMPSEMLGLGMSFEVLGPNNTVPTFTNIRSIKNSAFLPKANALSEELSESLSIFDRDGVRLSLTSRHAARVGFSGKFTSAVNHSDAPWVLSFLFGLALGSDRYSKLPDPMSSGFFEHAEVLQSLNGQIQTMRYHFGGQTVSTVSVPVRVDGQIIGAVYAEQNARTLRDFTDEAFSRLMLYSFAVSTASAFALVLYASWLSWRIRTLSRSANEAISESGKINDNFSGSKIQDELGDLSRSYAKLLARLKEYTHYLKTLSSKLSHELRTPLAIVSSSLDNLEHETLSEQARVYALRAKEGSTRLSSILNAMSAASRVEQAIGNAEMELIPLDDLISNLGAAYADVYPNVNVELNIRTHSDGYQLLAAGELLVQMLDKLVDNAADFCPHGGEIELGLYRQQQELVITVRNEGPILPKTMHKQLFDSMVSVRQNQHKEHAENHHLGLGLYIVRLIVDFHQGHVHGYNVPDGSGVIFEIRLPTRT